MKEKLAAQVAHRIVEHIREGGLEKGHHLGAQMLADLFKVSRAPVTEALRVLEEGGVVYSEPNRGFFVSRPIAHISASRPELASNDEEDKLYCLIAEDRLSGRLPARVSENELMRRYSVPRGRLQLLLGQIAEEGWVERLPGHGWAFGTTLSSGEAYAKAYYFRAAIESQAVLQPEFRIEQEGLDLIRRQQVALLDGEMFTLPRARLFEINTTFHETIVSWSQNSFFLDASRRINRLRRLIEYRVTSDRSRLKRQSEEHLLILDKIEAGNLDEVSVYLRDHITAAFSIKEPDVERLASKASQ
jgi:DNA-binding GntR family transcriptional regulator